jgi:hypothetical protein
MAYFLWRVHNTTKWAHPREQEWRERERDRVRAAQMQEDQAREREQERRAYEVPTVPSFFVADPDSLDPDPHLSESWIRIGIKVRIQEL